MERLLGGLKCTPLWKCILAHSQEESTYIECTLCQWVGSIARSAQGGDKVEGSRSTNQT